MQALITSMLIIISLTFLALGVLRGSGYVGATEKNGGNGCNCHSFSPSTQVTGWVSGVDSVQTGASVNYRLYLIGGPRVSGGFNLTALRGKVYPLDNSSKLLHFAAGDSQLTHSTPKGFTADTVFWSFRYVAPTTVGTDTIYSVVNSTNGNGQADNNDRWNFGRKFVIRVVNNPVSVEDNQIIASQFELYQNYPNPFSASGSSASGSITGTVISWQSKISAWQKLKVYDALGNEIATLVDEYRDAGTYNVQFSLNNLQLTSGIYFYQLEIGNFTQTKKMILIR